MTENTKSHPGPFDALEKARPDELIFTLIERDPDAPATINFWCDLRRKRARSISDIEKRKAELRQISEAEFIGIEMQERQAGKGEERPPEAKQLYSGQEVKRDANADALGLYRAKIAEADYFVKEALDAATGLIDGSDLGDLQRIANELHELSLKASPFRAGMQGG